MKKIVLAILAIGLSTQFYSQVVEDGSLPEVEIRVDYKYLNSVDNTVSDVPVNLLHEKVAKFDISSAKYYEAENDLYRVYFQIPDGKIVAAYDENGKIQYTIERFENVALPLSVIEAITEKFPGWKIAKDVYRVNYDLKNGAEHSYKLVLNNGGESVRVRIDEKGTFL